MADNPNYWTNRLAEDVARREKLRQQRRPRQYILDYDDYGHYNNGDIVECHTGELIRIMDKDYVDDGGRGVLACNADDVESLFNPLDFVNEEETNKNFIEKKTNNRKVFVLKEGEN
jgi:hypothetical protein